MSAVHVVGIDPGLVDTGVVSMTFHPEDKRIGINSLVLPKPEFDRDPTAVWQWIQRHAQLRTEVYVEKFVPRPGMNTSPAMLELEQHIKAVVPIAQMVRNMGVKQVITREVMLALKVWQFAQSTHHQDLRSAARIGLFGMAKDETMNCVLAQALMDDADGLAWTIHH